MATLPPCARPPLPGSLYQNPFDRCAARQIMKSILCGATRRFVKRQRAFGVIATRSDVEPGPYESLPGVETSSLLLLCRRMVNVNPPSGPVGLVAVFGEPS